MKGGTELPWELKNYKTLIQGNDHTRPYKRTLYSSVDSQHHRKKERKREKGKEKGKGRKAKERRKRKREREKERKKRSVVQHLPSSKWPWVWAQLCQHNPLGTWHAMAWLRLSRAGSSPSSSLPAGSSLHGGEKQQCEQPAHTEQHTDVLRKSSYSHFFLFSGFLFLFFFFLLWRFTFSKHILWTSIT